MLSIFSTSSRFVGTKVRSIKKLLDFLQQHHKIFIVSKKSKLVSVDFYETMGGGEENELSRVERERK